MGTLSAWVKQAELNAGLRPSPRRKAVCVRGVLEGSSPGDPNVPAVEDLPQLWLRTWRARHFRAAAPNRLCLSRPGLRASGGGCRGAQPVPLPPPPGSAVGAVRLPGGVLQAEAAALSPGSLPGGVEEEVISASRISERYPLHESGEVRLLRPRPPADDGGERGGNAGGTAMALELEEDRGAMAKCARCGAVRAAIPLPPPSVRISYPGTVRT